jgi:hypothetical protein
LFLVVSLMWVSICPLPSHPPRVISVFKVIRVIIVVRVIIVIRGYHIY